MSETLGLANDYMAVKRMRKGTRSCTECRRRKIRCIYPPDDRTCFSCKARGSRCVEQSTEGLKNDRGHHSLPEQVVGINAHQGQRSHHDGNQAEHTENNAELSDIIVSTGINDQSPLFTVLAHAKLLDSTTLRMDESSTGQTTKETQKAGISASKDHPPCSNLFSQVQLTVKKSTSVCSMLRAVLPSYDTIISALSSNGSWWSSYRQKAYAVSQAPPLTLEAFAKRAYTSHHPAELAALTLAFARSSGKHYHLYALVDDLVISDFTITTTIEGMECLILLAKLYTDVGHPKRAWLVWRKGVTAAQLMGLCHGKNSSATQLRLWSAIYHGDRFCSLLLGVPYGFNDNHCISIIEASKKTLSPVSQFVLQCAAISGKIIDRNLTSGKPSFAKAMELDEELESNASSLPEDWWNIPAELPEQATYAEMDSLRERLLQQFYFYWVKVYLHLPFLVKSSTKSPNATSRSICIQASRQILRRYRLLRAANLAGYCLFECKTTDFASFSITIILLIGIFHSGDTSMPPPNLDEDLGLIAAADGILQREELEKNCGLAAQCRKTLRILSGTQEGESSEYSMANELREVVIPYFGAVVRQPIAKRLAQMPTQPKASDSNQILETQASSSQSPMNGSSAADSVWSVGACSLEFVRMGDLESMQNDSTPWWEAAAIGLDPGWSILTDMNWDLLPNVDDISPNN
ncbi:hypothetical protein V1517DRAFT_332656 [Lipomyces orientalis]|uniref:Uncharacterized protein n=1 Tax=Lipomyces orientalis TaxID=1233043 RepID=A0ACC3TEX1_9ASCO